VQYNIGKYNRLMAVIGITKLHDGVTGQLLAPVVNDHIFVMAVPFAVPAKLTV